MSKQDIRDEMKEVDGNPSSSSVSAEFAAMWRAAA